MAVGPFIGLAYVHDIELTSGDQVSGLLRSNRLDHTANIVDAFCCASAAATPGPAARSGPGREALWQLRSGADRPGVGSGRPPEHPRLPAYYTERARPERWPPRRNDAGSA